jgi:mRNA interferase MazF
MYMASYFRGSVVLVRYPFTDVSGAKVRPAVVVSGVHESNDLIIVPMTSRTGGLTTGEFVLADYRSVGLNVPTAVKRGLHAIDERLVLKVVGALTAPDLAEVDRALAYWLALKLAP